MNYFIHKTKSGAQPQAGYERVGIYPSVATGEVWVLWRTDKTVDEIKLEVRGELYVVGDVEDFYITNRYPTIEDYAISEIRTAGSDKMEALNDLAGGYFDNEQKTFERQYAEAKAYTAWVSSGSDPLSKPITPMLTGMVAKRTKLKSVADIAAKVMQNVAIYMKLGEVLGTQQDYLDQIEDAPTLSDKLVIEWTE